jgi:hypothetical protein
MSQKLIEVGLAFCFAIAAFGAFICENVGGTVSFPRINPHFSHFIFHLENHFPCHTWGKELLLVVLA